MDIVPILLFGFVLGVKHAFEADHVIAVSTMVTAQKNPFKTALVGTFWGIGHTTTLFVIGLIVLLLKISIPERLSLSLEFGVGIMLVVLGLISIYKSRIPKHEHEHKHEGEAHEHPHLQKNDHHQHHKSFFIGIIHGLAGSGALMILVLSTVHSVITGIYYILIFGIGSIIGMSLMSLFIGLPFVYSSNKFPKIDQYIRGVAGILSIGFGMFLMYEIGVVEGLFRL